jgi:hypothetical protein
MKYIQTPISHAAEGLYWRMRRMTIIPSRGLIATLKEKVAIFAEMESLAAC